MSDCFPDIPDEDLNCTWRDSDLARLALHIVSWEELAPFWGLTVAEEEEIRRDNPKYAAQKLAALCQWKVNSKGAATYRQLVRVFSKLGEMGLVEKVREILLTPEEVPAGVPGDVLSSYQGYLRKSYIQLPHPGMIADQWPILSTPAYVQLSLSKQPRSQHTRMEQFPTHYSPFLRTTRLMEHYKIGEDEPEAQEVRLPELLSKCYGGRVVIKGLPGSGKTTLTWHANQQWAKKEEFQQFSLILSIPLRSPRAQQATCLADLICHPDEEHRKAIAQAISAGDGEGVCFWFDGWDEMPQEVQKESFIASFIQRDTPGSSLPKSTTVVTTRPEALSPKSSEEIWLNRLSLDEANEIIVKGMEGTDHDSSELITKLERNTSLQAFCLTVPINIAILVSLFFLFRSGLPTTQTELFECLVLNLLLRNLQSRWKLVISSLKTFAALPDSPAESFRSICKVAFNGVMDTQTVFFRSDVSKHQVLSTFGLMEIRPRMEWYGVEEELTFLHTTLQEFLAAVHLTTLENEEQVRIIKEIVKSKSWHQKSILQFFAGLTRLDNSEVFTMLLQSCTTLDRLSFLYFGEQLQQLSSFVMLVNCAFEAQSVPMCQKLTLTHVQFHPSTEFDLPLAFQSTHFDTADFSHLGYFIGWFCQQKTCELTFENCYITPQQFKVFVDQIKQVCTQNEFHRPSLSLNHLQVHTGLTVRFRYERVHEQLYALCGLIRDTHLVSHFSIVANYYAGSIHSQEFIDYHATMKNIVEAFARNSSCSSLILHHLLILENSPMCTVFAAARYSEYYAVLLITFCRHVKKVAFPGFFQLFYSYPLFARSLQYNTNIQCLDLSQNTMCNAAIANLAQALSFNRTITDILFGDLLSETLETFLTQSQLSTQSGLERVFVGRQTVPLEDQLKRINRTRLLSQLQVISYVPEHEGPYDWVPDHYRVYNGFTRRIHVPGAESDSDEDGDSSNYSVHINSIGHKCKSNCLTQVLAMGVLRSSRKCTPKV